jgi:hypothetical protein
MILFIISHYNKATHKLCFLAKSTESYRVGKIAYEWFLSILQEECLPCPVHPALFHNFGCCYIILMGHKKIQIKMNNSI